MEKVTHSSILARRIPWTIQSVALQRVGHDFHFHFWTPYSIHYPIYTCVCQAEYIMRNAGLEETQAGIKTARRNTNNLSYANDTTLMAESEEEQKSLLMKVKEESEKAGLKLNIQKMKILASSSIQVFQSEVTPLCLALCDPKGYTVLSWLREVFAYNMLIRFVVAFLPSRKHLLIPWLQSPSAVTLEPQKSLTVCIVSPSISHEVMGPDTMNLVFLNVEF